MQWLCVDCKQLLSDLKLDAKPKNNTEADLNNVKLDKILQKIESIEKNCQIIPNIEENCNNISALAKNEDLINIKTVIVQKIDESNQSKVLYSNILKTENWLNTEKNLTTSTYRPGIIIKPKTAQTSEHTKQEIRSKINPTKAGISIHSIKNISKGGVIIKTGDAESTSKLLTEAQNNLNQNEYVAYVTEPGLPRVKIIGADKNYTNEEIFEELVMQNHSITEEDKQMEIKYASQMQKSGKCIIFLETTGNTCKKILKNGTINLGWTNCKVVEDLNVKQCMNCCGFGHKKRECQREPTCQYCAGKHKSDECQENNQLCCNNCNYVNNKYKDNLNVHHAATSENCTILQKKIRNAREQINYH